MPVTTPKKIGGSTRDFCSFLNNRAQPQFINVSPGTGAIENECFLNVQRQAKSSGGKLVFGWRIWLWEGVCIEAEHHGIWEQLNGTLLDITPTPHGESKILFVRDDEATFDFVQFKRRDNIRKPITNDPNVRDYLTVSAQMQSLMEQYSVGREIKIPVEVIKPLAMQSKMLLQQIWRRYLGPNDLCTCNSGKKVKKCCGLEFAIAADPFNPNPATQ
ncbi:MAG: SEC-C domain-containing protein [Kordiimonadaceae bacterium]|nr:SEC-C domain-containing protein [Kordiimonadaceae bacterium]